jgi:hypothetical protein
LDFIEERDSPEKGDWSDDLITREFFSRRLGTTTGQ